MLEKYPGESALFDLDCTNLLADGETITGTPVMGQNAAQADLDSLQFGSVLVNTTPITYPDGRVVAPGKLIQVRIAGGSLKNNVDDSRYSVTATFTTSNNNTLVARALLNVLQVYP